MGLDGQQQPISIRASRDSGAGLGNRNPSDRQNKETASHCMTRTSLFINKGRNTDI